MMRIMVTSILALSVLMAGCGIHSDYMKEVESPSAAAVDPAAATVVFVRPSGYGKALKTVILDEHGRFLGESWGKTYFSVKVPPGEHTFISWTEGTPALRAKLEPGKTYYVQQSITMGVWSGRVRLFAMGPQREDWPKLTEWLADSTMLIPNEAAGQEFLRQKADRVQEVVAKGLANYAGYEDEARKGDPSAVEKRTLLPQDGVVAAR
jgi:hypothetical protein